jgi:hypothetical protein
MKGKGHSPEQTDQPHAPLRLESSEDRRTG